MKLPFAISKEIETVKNILLDAIEKGDAILDKGAVLNGDSKRTQALHHLARSGYIVVDGMSIRIRASRFSNDTTQV